MTKGRRPGALYTYRDVVHGQETLVTRYESVEPDNGGVSLRNYRPTKLSLDALSSTTNKYDTFEMLSDLRLLQRIAFKDKQDEPT